MAVLCSRRVTTLALNVLVLALALMGGSSGLSNSQDIVGERVEIRMLTYADLNEYSRNRT